MFSTTKVMTLLLTSLLIYLAIELMEDLAMRRDPSEFRARFNAYKNGKSVSELYAGGLPTYAEGKSDAYADTVDFLKQYEGFKDTTYLDGNGVPTIGYGFTDSTLVGKGKITKAAADARLRQEIISRDRFLSRLKNWDKLNEGSKTALRSYYYNYPAGFKDTTKFMKAWNAGDYAEAIRQVDAGWNDAKNPGLRTRRQAEQQMLREDPFLMSTMKAPEVKLAPIVNVPVSTAVRQTIPAEQTTARWAGAENVSPYITGRPMIQLQPKVKLPTVKETVELTTWKPGFEDGKSPQEWADDWKERLLSSAKSKVLLKWNATGQKPQPESSELYTQRRIKETTWKKPSGRKVIDETLNFLGGDVKQALDAGSAAVKGNYAEAGLLAAGLLLPSALKNSGKLIYKGLRKTGVPRWFAHDVVSNPKRVINDWMNDEYAFTQKGVNKLLERDNEQLNFLGEPIKQNIIKDELVLRLKRMKFARQHGMLNDIVTDRPKDVDILYRYDTKMDPKFILGKASRPINIAYYEHPSSSRFKYKWDRYDGKELPITLGHEFVHRLEPDYRFAPHFKTSSELYGETGYHVPAFGMELVTDGAYHMPSAKSLMLIPEVQQAFSPTIRRYNTNVNRIAEAKKLGMSPEFETHVWNNSPAEVVADLRGAIASGMSEEDIYKFMWDKHKYGGDKIRELREIGFKNGKSPIYIKPSKRGSFTAAAKRRGMTVSQLESAVLKNPSKYSKAMRKKALFSRNARSWSK